MSKASSRRQGIYTPATWQPSGARMIKGGLIHPKSRVMAYLEANRIYRPAVTQEKV